jgi:hypothetical protein
VGTSDYSCEATSLGGFVQQLAVAYIANGYWFYVTGHVPERKDAAAVDRKLVARYGIGLSKWAVARRKRAGGANLQYIRFGRFFVLLATPGEHPFFREEAAGIRKVQQVPIKFGGYSIGHRGGHVRVAIERGEYKRLKAYFLDLAVRRTGPKLEAEFGRLPFEPYAPVRGQLLCILRAVNRARKVAGYEPVPNTCLRLNRRSYRPFEKRASEPAAESPDGSVTLPG